MTPSEFDDFNALLSITAEQYGKTLSKGLIGLYWQALQKYDLAAVRASLSAHITNPDTGQFMPKVADIVRAIAGRTEDRALIAWSAVDDAARKIGPYRDVAFDDPIIHRVLADMGGWIALGSKTEEEWTWVEKEFVTRYRGILTAAAPSLEYPAVLRGIASAQNEAESQARAEPVVCIGNPAAARRVIEGGSERAGRAITFLPAGERAKALVKQEEAI